MRYMRISVSYHGFALALAAAAILLAGFAATETKAQQPPATPVELQADAVADYAAVAACRK